MIDWTTKFSGLIVTGYIKFSMKSQRKTKPKNLDPIPLIPSYTGNAIIMKLWTD